MPETVPRHFPENHSPETETSSEAHRRALYDAEQAVEDRRREQLFTMAEPAYWVDRLHNPDKQAKLYGEFMSDKNSSDNMGQRLQLAVEKYLGKIGFIELAMISDPNDTAAREAKKQEFHDLVDWLYNHGADMHLFKKETDNCVSYERRSPVFDPDNFVVLERYRNLCDGVLLLDEERFGSDRAAQFRIMKQSSFVVPTGSVGEFEKRFGPGYTSSPSFVSAMDRALHSGASFINPSLRTSYYMQISPVHPSGEGHHD